MQGSLPLVNVLLVLVQVAWWALLGQGALALIVGRGRHGNPFYRFFQVVTHPVVMLMRRLVPRRIVDAHIPVISWFLLLWLWITLAISKRFLCVQYALPC